MPSYFAPTPLGDIAQAARGYAAQQEQKKKREFEGMQVLAQIPNDYGMWSAWSENPKKFRRLFQNVFGFDPGDKPPELSPAVKNQILQQEQGLKLGKAQLGEIARKEALRTEAGRLLGPQVQRGERPVTVPPLGLGAFSRFGPPPTTGTVPTMQTRTPSMAELAQSPYARHVLSQVGFDFPSPEEGFLYGPQGQQALGAKYGLTPTAGQRLSAETQRAMPGLRAEAQWLTPGGQQASFLTGKMREEGLMPSGYTTPQQRAQDINVSEARVRLLNAQTQEAVASAADAVRGGGRLPTEAEVRVAHNIFQSYAELKRLKPRMALGPGGIPMPTKEMVREWDEMTNEERAAADAEIRNAAAIFYGAGRPLPYSIEELMPTAPRRTLKRTDREAHYKELIATRGPAWFVKTNKRTMTKKRLYNILRDSGISEELSTKLTGP